MKIILTADWLKNVPKPKIHWIKDIRDQFGFSYEESKEIADYFFAETKNLELKDSIVVDSEFFSAFNNLELNFFDDIWYIKSKSIRPHPKEKQNQQLDYVDNPFIAKTDELDKEVENLLQLIPSKDHEEAKEIINRLLEAQCQLNHPFASAK